MNLTSEELENLDAFEKELWSLINSIEDKKRRKRERDNFVATLREAAGTSKKNRKRQTMMAYAWLAPGVRGNPPYWELGGFRWFGSWGYLKRTLRRFGDIKWELGKDGFRGRSVDGNHDFVLDVGKIWRD